MTDRRIVFVVFDGFQPLDLTGPREVFRGAGDAYACEVVAPRAGPVRSGSGLLVHAERAWRTWARPGSTRSSWSAEGVWTGPGRTRRWSPGSPPGGRCPARGLGVQRGVPAGGGGAAGRAPGHHALGP
ncbi:hypothetical protein SVIOM74S_03623 [Streptomyces violarus]